jgi:hypothetical protein
VWRDIFVSLILFLESGYNIEEEGKSVVKICRVNSSCRITGRKCVGDAMAGVNLDLFNKEGSILPCMKKSGWRYLRTSRTGWKAG